MTIQFKTLMTNVVGRILDSGARGLSGLLSDPGICMPDLELIVKATIMSLGMQVTAAGEVIPVAEPPSLFPRPGDPGPSRFRKRRGK